MSESDDIFVDDGQVSPSGDNNLDPLETGYNPPDRPAPSWRGDTAEEARQGETLDQKLAEEVPEASEQDILGADEQPQAGRLVASDDPYADLESEETATDVGGAAFEASAEEAAMHIQDEV